MDSVLIYGFIISLVILGSSLAGWATAHRFSLDRNRKGFLILGLVAFAVWGSLSWGARYYGETDYPGWPWAEWWAHQGKWFMFLGLVLFGISLALTAESQRIKTSHKILIPFIMVSVILVVIERSCPVYLMLGEGQRDADDYLIQNIDHEYTCGAVALLNYLELYRNHGRLTEREVSRACNTTAEGTTMSDLLQAVHAYGLTNATCTVRTYTDILESDLPTIVSISTLPGLRHATLLVSLDRDTARFIDPSYGAWQCSLDRFKKILFGKSIDFGVPSSSLETNSRTKQRAWMARALIME
jgi:predicted double-glycine peptidase